MDREVSGPPILRGRCILLIADEPLVAMEAEYLLVEAGCEVIGPAASVDAAGALLSRVECDAALVGNGPDDETADAVRAMLTRHGVPFTFANGSGPQADLSESSRRGSILAAIAALFEDDTGDDGPIPLHARRPDTSAKRAG